MTRLAFLFDLDGTLVDTDHQHHAAFAALLAERGTTLDFDTYRDHIMGKPNPEIMARFFPGEADRHTEIAEEKEALYRAALPDHVPPVDGIHALLDHLDAAGHAVAVVTNAPRATAEASLRASGLAPRLPYVVIGDECPQPKPDPAPYRIAMEALDIAPDRAIAFEDSPSGLTAAAASGAAVFGLTTSLDAAALLQAGAHQAIADFTDPALWAYLEHRKAAAQ